MFGGIISSVLRNAKRNGVTKEEEMNTVLHITMKLREFMAIIFHFLNGCHENIRGLTGQQQLLQVSNNFYIFLKQDFADTDT